uniref:Arylsulfatase-like n=1 Tax=Phallusia mammillata TaxID=59560 RepID=A0A6F9D737_9ASCI|nr:arylsulfatase-like [Phallusia mammillata]
MSSKCFLYCNATMKEQPINPEMLTQRIAADAVQFVKDNHDNPFFLYMGMPQTHTAMICSTKFCNKSRRGIYGDNVNEMSWAVGEVVNVVKQLGIEENTLVMFISDHGPQIEECFHGGSPGPLKGGKATSWEGGIHVPSIAWWPGKIPPGSVNHHVLSTMDVFPTLLALAGENNVGKQGTFLDGIRVDQLFAENHENVKPPHKILFHYCSKQLFAVRLGRYKIHYYTQNVEAHNYSSNCVDGQPMGDMIANMDCSRATKQSPPIMFDLETDPGERFQLEASLHEDVLTEAQTLIDEHRKTLTPVPQQLGNWNDDLQPCCNPPHCKCNEYDDSKFQQQVYKNEL